MKKTTLGLKISLAGGEDYINNAALKEDKFLNIHFKCAHEG